MPQSWKLDDPIDPANPFSVLLYRICAQVERYAEAIEREFLPKVILKALSDGPLTLETLHRRMQQQGYHGDRKALRAHLVYIMGQRQAPVQIVRRGVYGLTKRGEHGE